MQNKKVGMMKNTFIQITLCWLIVVFSVMGIGKVIKGEDNETKTIQRWSTQLLYDTTNACYQGTYRWIVMANPLLIGQQPPPIVQRQMIQHCFCVMDKIRNEFDMEKYVNLIKSGLSVGQLFMDKAYECIDEYETLKGVIIMPDNSTKTDNDSVVIPTEPEGHEESTPDEELEQEQTIFKG